MLTATGLLLSNDHICFRISNRESGIRNQHGFSCACTVLAPCFNF
nr:MAG TPA: YecM protein [Caudoviricetes sp.]